MPDESRSPQFDELLKTGFANQLVAARDSEFRRLLPIKRDEVRDEIRRYRLHDELITVVSSLFRPGGSIFEETGYEFISCEPLVELADQGCKSFDAVIANRKQGVAIFPECKTSVADPNREITDLYRTVSDVEARLDSLQGRLGFELRHREYAVCVPAGEFDGLARALAAKEASGEIDLSKNPYLKIWYVNRFGKETISLLTQIKRREDRYNQHLDATLTRLLAEGREITDEMVNVCFPSSHHLVKLSVALVAIHRQRGGDVAEIARSELEGVLSDFATIPHYDIRNLGPKIVQDLVSALSELNLLKEDDEGKIEFKVRGRKIDTVLKEIERNFVDARAESLAQQEAREAAVESVLGKYRRFE